MGKRQRVNVQGDNVQEPSDDKSLRNRCSPGIVRSLGNQLPTSVVEEIKKIGLGNLLKLHLDEIGLGKKICGELLDIAVVHEQLDLIELPIGDVSLWISKEVVKHVVDLSAGSGKLLTDCKTDYSDKMMYEAMRFVCNKFPLQKKKASTAAGAAKDSEAGGAQGAQDSKAVDEESKVVEGEHTTTGHQEASGAAAVEGERTTTRDQAASAAAAGTSTATAKEEFGDYDLTSGEKRRNIFTPERIENLVKHYQDEGLKQYNVDTDMLVRLFIGVAIDKMLKPGTANFVRPAQQDLKMLKEVDWPLVVFQGLKDECKEFPEKRMGAKTTYMNCCVPVLLVVFLDCIKGNDLNVDEGGRMYLYDDNKVKELLKEGPNDRSKKRRGPMISKPLQAFILKKWEDTCYAEFVNKLPKPKIVEVLAEPMIIEEPVVPVAEPVITEVPVVPVGIEDLDIDKEYKKHVLDAGNKCFLYFVGRDREFRVNEKTYVECFKEQGQMHSEILYLVCHLWSQDWEDDKIILSKPAADELLGTYKGAKSSFLDRELTTKKMKSVNQIFIPIVTKEHWSLVVVTKKPEERVYILDSLATYHKVEADTVIQALTEHLRSKHSMDISQYRKEDRAVMPQANCWDCGFHVLLYIQRFKSMDIYNLSKDEVFMFRKRLAVELLHHKMNRVRPGGPINEVPAPLLQQEENSDGINKDEKGEDAGSEDRHSKPLTDGEDAGNKGRHSLPPTDAEPAPLPQQGARVPTVDDPTSQVPPTAASSPTQVAEVPSTTVGHVDQGATTTQADGVPTTAAPTTEVGLSKDMAPGSLNTNDSSMGDDSSMGVPHTPTRSDASSGEAVQTHSDGNSRKRGAENCLFEESTMKKNHRHRAVKIDVTRRTNLPTPESKLYQSICVDNTYAEEEIIHIKNVQGKLLSIKSVDIAKFISGGVLTCDILQAFIEFLKHDEGNGCRKRIFMPPQDYATLDENGNSIVVPTIWNNTEVIFLPVRHEDLWIIYVTFNSVYGVYPNFMSFRERGKGLTADARKTQRKFIFKALSGAVKRKGCNNYNRYVNRITYTEEIIEWLNVNFHHRVGLLAMYFLENFSGTDFKPSVESLDKYNISVLEYMVGHPRNKANLKKEFCMD